MLCRLILTSSNSKLISRMEARAGGGLWKLVISNKKNPGIIGIWQPPLPPCLLRKGQSPLSCARDSFLQPKKQGSMVDFIPTTCLFSAKATNTSCNDQLSFQCSELKRLICKKQLCVPFHKPKCSNTKTVAGIKSGNLTRQLRRSILGLGCNSVLWLLHYAPSQQFIAPWFTLAPPLWWQGKCEVGTK